MPTKKPADLQLPDYKAVEVEVEGGRKYKLGFNRATVKSMERNGFDMASMGQTPLSSISALVAGAFSTFNPKMPEDEIFEVWAEVEDKNGLIAALSELYGACTYSLVGNPTGPTRAKWRVL